MTDIHHFPNSSSLKSAEYDHKTRTLDVTFNTGRTFTYQDVGPDLWRGLKTAGSAGSFLHNSIRGRH